VGQEIRPDDPASIREMFERLAPAYDRLNTALTFGLVRGWRRELAREARLSTGARVVDVCTGTGQTLAEVAGRVGPGGVAVGIDFTPGMLRRARGLLVLADATSLPLPDAAFDAAVSAFALRDVADQRAMLREMVRVTRPGGRVGILEIGRPRTLPLRLGFDAWFRGAVPRIAAAVGHGESHRFLVRSLDFLPEPDELASWMRDEGLGEVTWRELSLGAARLFAGTRT
jgi:demethylmenaquinone methyltransferase / 2-methoxy-6-polyprenyl-1,4-benzoquinol methylase